MTHRFSLFLIATVYCLLFSTPSPSANLDQQRPDGVSDEKWSSLKATVQAAKFLPTPEGTGGSRSEFGRSISVDGDRALIGAPRMVENRGAALMYEYDGAHWNETDILIPTDAERGDFFGISVSLSGDVALIGADRSDDFENSSGSAYIYHLSNGSWIEAAKLNASDAGEGHRFGYAVDLDSAGDRVLIGASGAAGLSQDSGAAYVFDFDGNNWLETAKLTANDGGIVDWFGVTVSLSGDRALIGAPRHDDPLNGLDSGAAYVFEFDGNSWLQTARIRAFDGANDDYFAYAVSLENDRALLGSRFDDDLGENSGSAYVFDFNGVNWTQTEKLTAADGAAGDYFGNSVSLLGNQIMIGARQHDQVSNNEGAAYLFQFGGSNWSQTAKLNSSDAIPTDQFGYTVSLSEDRVLISALGDDDAGVESGTVFVFDYDGSSWSENHKLTGRQGAAYDEFGRTSVSISGNLALVGAYRDFEPGVGYSGSAYVFEYDGFNWHEQTKLKPTNPELGDWFGRAVSLSGNRAIVGTYRTYSAYIFEFDGSEWHEMTKLTPSNVVTGFDFGIAVDIEGDRALIGTREVDAGLAYVYDYDGIQWNLTTSLTSSDGEDGDLFGNAVSLMGDRALIGANGDDDLGTDAGAAYVFDFDGSEWNESTKLTASDGSAGRNFAWSVDLAQDRLIIGNRSDAAYLFEFDGTNWTETTKLTSFGSGNTGAFGETVSLKGDLAVVGAPFSDVGGSVFVFQFDGSSWYDVTQIIPTGVEGGDQFGHAVSLSDDRVLVGAYGDDDRGTNAGAAYVFDLNSAYLIGGQVTGLAKGNSVVLQNNAGDDLTVNENGGFVFDMNVDDLTGYSVTVLTQPTAPNQTCLISGGDFGDGSGTLSGSNVFTVMVDCSINQYFIGGNTTDLLPGNQIILHNNGTDELTVIEEGTFVFSTPLDDLQQYQVTINTQPSNPIQTCELTNATGQISGNDINSVIVSCDFGDDLIYRNGFDSGDTKKQDESDPES